MSMYLVEASKKNGLFKPYEPQKYYLMSQDRLAKLIAGKISLVVWSARWVNLDLSPLEHLEAVHGEIEVMD